jgi:hypothetical protein
MDSIHWHYMKVKGQIQVPIALSSPIKCTGSSLDLGDRVEEEEIPMLLTNNSSYPSGSNASEHKNILSHRRIILSIRLLALMLY